MGNIFSSKKTVVEDNDEVPTEYDMNLYKEKRERLFYGTILVCILYAIFAFILLVLSYLSSKIKYLLLNKFLPFTSIYIIGTIIIILFLLTQIFGYKPIKHDRTNNYDDLSCPDYWTLETLPIDEYSKNIFDSNVNHNLFKYRCKLNNNIFNKYDIYNANSNNFYITNLNSDLLAISSNDKPRNNQINSYNNMHLYTNINDDSNFNIIKTTFPEGSNIVHKELIKNTLLMNNYGINSDDSNATTYIPRITTDTIRNLSLNIDKINFNNNLTSHAYYTGANKTTVTFTSDSLNQIRNMDYKKKLLENNITLTKINTGVAGTTCETTGEGVCYNLGLYSSLVTSNNIVGLIDLDINYNFNNYKQHSNILLENGQHECYITSLPQPPSTIISKDISSSSAGTKIDIPIKINIMKQSYQNNSPITYNKTSRVENTNVNIPLVCDNVYPLFLASKDIELSKNNKNFDQNVLRCAYSKLCNVPWSDLNCDKYTGY